MPETHTRAARSAQAASRSISNTHTHTQGAAGAIIYLKQEAQCCSLVKIASPTANGVRSLAHGDTVCHKCGPYRQSMTSSSRPSAQTQTMLVQALKGITGTIPVCVCRSFLSDHGPQCKFDRDNTPVHSHMSP
eukprot:1161418-Pelagomonas_calceolata.AAC.6